MRTSLYKYVPLLSRMYIFIVAADICITNAGSISANLRDLQNILGEVIKAIDTKDRQAIHDYFAKSKERRDEILLTVEKKFDPN